MDDFDPLRPETLDSPYEDYRRLRAGCPVAHTDAWGGFWALTRHADVAWAAADYAAFTTTVQNVVPKVATTGRRPPLHLDPPEHSPYRRAINRVLVERRVESLRPFIVKVCDELIDAMLSRGGGEICADYGAVLPIRVFAEWMNLPPQDQLWLADVARVYGAAVQSADQTTTQATSLQLYDMARGLLESRKAVPLHPDEDVTSALLAARVDGQPLPDELILGTIRQVLVVGIIAPQVVFGSTVVHLCRHPELQAQLRAEPELIPAAMEEFLRLYTPYRGFARTPTQDVTLHGVTIPKDEPVALIYASANRDETVFEAAETFRLDRPNMKDSLAFGRGPHTCPGSGLARLELSIALERLLAKTSAIEIAGEIIPTRMPEIGTLVVPVKLVGR
ncbi:cytochrome P450 [Asticcacaulis biprosthecium C19]|uniref:Cytochrome P450 n=1 Tax=Asticcacaulis biprosthecium C19 TaxID=715226 RepID=F4QTJ9_9CAUL|nr:cytochrome P450 [Asticcacaulis biprosthecium]EGF90069.1 cytochrome P450 [Asticcacaulis biprosthecium C19]